MRKFDAILFDMDGTLVDSEEYHALAWTRLMERFGLSPEHGWLDAFVGTTDEDTTTGILARYPELAAKGNLLEMKQVIFRELVAEHGDTMAMPGIFQPLEELAAAGIPMAVGTNGVLVNCRAVLRAAGLLHFFSALSAVDTVAAGKPAPDIYLAAAEHLGCAPERCAVVEDSSTGARSGKAAGCFVVGVRSGFPQDLSMADIVVDSSAAALEWIIDQLGGVTRKFALERNPACPARTPAASPSSRRTN